MQNILTAYQAQQLFSDYSQDKINNVSEKISENLKTEFNNILRKAIENKKSFFEFVWDYNNPIFNKNNLKDFIEYLELNGYSVNEEEWTNDDIGSIEFREHVILDISY
jgi:hypothetical protein